MTRLLARKPESRVPLRFRVACTVGTRPEALKMAPVIRALRAHPQIDVRVVATGQHRELLAQALAAFSIAPDVDLEVMQPSQKLAPLTARLLERLDGYLERDQPDLVIAQGDTTTVFATALAAFYRHIPFAHVEAGLRSFDPEHPFPEEMNRSVVARLARLHFAPLESNRRNLLAEGVPDERIAVVGNTIVDAVLETAARHDETPVRIAANQRLVLLTVHRRESHGAPLAAILAAARELVDRTENVVLACPVHPNPAVAEPAHRILGGHLRIRLLPPLDYPTLVATLKRAVVVLTDSGGIQEEAPALGVPVLVLRHVTERGEAVEAGAAQLVGCDRQRIVAAALEILGSTARGEHMKRCRNLFGDGTSGARIAAGVVRFLEEQPAAEREEGALV